MLHPCDGNRYTLSLGWIDEALIRARCENFYGNLFILRHEGAP